MNTKRWLLAAVGVFAVTFVLDLIVHTNLLAGMYEATSHVWRPRDETQSMMWMVTGSKAAFALVFSWVYTRGYESGKAGLGQGVRYGVYVALLLMASQGFLWYVVIPIPMALQFAWHATVLVGCLAEGAVVGAIYRQ